MERIGDNEPGIMKAQRDFEIGILYIFILADADRERDLGDYFPLIFYMCGSRGKKEGYMKTFF